MTQPNLSCPQCCSNMSALENQYDAWICTICDCTWQISKHDIAVGDKIDIE